MVYLYALHTFFPTHNALYDRLHFVQFPAREARKSRKLTRRATNNNWKILLKLLKASFNVADAGDIMVLVMFPYTFVVIRVFYTILKFILLSSLSFTVSIDGRFFFYSVYTYFLLVTI